MKKRIRNILIALAILIVMIVVIIPGAFWIWDAFFVHVDDADLRLERPVIPDEENAYTYLVQATNFTYEPYSWDELYEMTTNGQWDAEIFAAFIETNQSQFALVDRALECKQMQVPEIASFSQPIPGLFHLRAVARNVSLRSRHLYESGQSAEALSMSCDLARMGVMLENAGGVIIHHLVALAIEGIALGDIERLMTVPLPQEILRHCSIRLSQSDSRRTSLANVFRTEHIVNCDGMDSVGEGPHELMGKGPFRDARYLYPATFHFFHPNATRRKFAETYRKLIDSADKSYAEIDFSFLPSRQKQSFWATVRIGKGLGSLYHDMFIGYLGAFLERDIRMDLNYSALRALLALKAYKQDKGSLPDSLQDLVPDYLDVVPVDSFDGKPLRYDRDKKIVYSVGKDLKDEGGLKEYEDPEYPDRWYSKDIVFDIEF